MNKPRIATHRRPGTIKRVNPRGRSQAAVELVRLEYEGARLEREYEQAQRRAKSARDSLIATRKRALELTTLLLDQEIVS